jgi:alcohol dehydrogenase
MGATKAVIVTDRGVSAVGVVDKTVASLKENDFPFVIFDGCLPDAPGSVLFAIADLARAENADALVAVGGGSNLDAAKAASMLVKHPEFKTLPEFLGPPGPPIPRQPGVKLVLIPTTSGTGSEVTSPSIISDDETHLKYSVVIAATDLSIVDPELVLGLPPYLTAVTGMDVLAHACEAYVTPSRKNPLSDQRALSAIRLVIEWLPVAVKDGSNLEARTNMSLACTIAGLAFNDSMTNVAHGIAHAFGAKSHMAHGLAAALAEPPSLESFAETVPDQIRTLGLALGADIPEGTPPKEIGKRTADTLRAFMKEIGIPALSAQGYSREDILGHKQAVLEEFQTTLGPIKVTPEIAEHILASMYDDYQ